MMQYTPGQDIFQTGTDTRFNSFTDPSAMAFNQQNGKWGVDPNMMTPAYTAAFRPTYNGYQNSPYSSARPGFWNSINQIINPFAGGGTNYGGDAYQQNAPYYDSFVNAIPDHSANLAQKWVVPGVASWLSYKYLSSPLGAGAARAAAGVATGLASGVFSPAQTAGIGRVAGGLGRLIGSGYLPMVATQVFSTVADDMIFDQYTAQRQTANTLRRNFSGVTFGDGSGNEVTGRGFSRTAAARQATSINTIANNDFHFNPSELANMTDLSARSGLLDSVNGGQIAERMKSISQQVKLLMSVGNSSDMKEAIEGLSKLSSSGVNFSDMTSVITKLGAMSSMGGVSLNKMLDTVGSSGAYMFGANGMTPYVGMTTAATAFGAFSTAERSGFMSKELLSRMGGVTGAAQSSVAGQLAAAATPYARMASMNRYLLGGEAHGGVVGNVSKFGGFIASGDPISNIGRYEVTSPELMSKDLNERGLGGIMENLLNMDRDTPGTTHNGKIEYYRAVELTSKMMHIPMNEAKAMVDHQLVLQDPASRRVALQSLESSRRENKSAYSRDMGFDSGVFGGMKRRANRLYRGGQEVGNKITGEAAQGMGRIADALQKIFTDATHNVDFNKGAFTGDQDAYEMDISGAEDPWSDSSLAAMAEGTTVMVGGTAAIAGGLDLMGAGLGTMLTGVGFFPGLAMLGVGAATATAGGMISAGGANTTLSGGPLHQGLEEIKKNPGLIEAARTGKWGEVRTKLEGMQQRGELSEGVNIDDLLGILNSNKVSFNKSKNSVQTLEEAYGLDKEHAPEFNKTLMGMTGDKISDEDIEKLRVNQTMPIGSSVESVLVSARKKIAHAMGASQSSIDSITDSKGIGSDLTFIQANKALTKEYENLKNSKNIIDDTLRVKDIANMTVTNATINLQGWSLGFGGNNSNNSTPTTGNMADRNGSGNAYQPGA